MNTKEQPKGKLQKLIDLAPGTVFEADGAFWIITTSINEGKQLVVNVQDGSVLLLNVFGAVQPFYGRFTMEGI